MSVNLYNATTDTLKNVAGDIINVHSVNEMVAPVEEGVTASRAYSEGEQFIIDNVLCYAMTNIAQGEEFDYDVNYYESSPLAEQVDDKQNKTDNNLTTTSKQIVGAINEVKSAITAKGQSVVLYIGTGGNFTTPIPDNSKYLIVKINTPNGGNTTKIYPTELIRATSIHESAYWNTVNIPGYEVLAVYDITKTSITPILFSHGGNTGDIAVTVTSIN